ncbi:MAG: hypothetical protein HUJ95_02790 [Bacteroidales bacterium]|nr:hypothetical protein [Bacteroidales bacterium]
MVASFANDEITIIKPSRKEVRGTVIPDWTNTTEVKITHCSVQPSSSTDSMDGRVLGEEQGLTVYCPTGTEVNTIDRVRARGKLYILNGEPSLWHSPTGNRSNLQLNLKRWTG